MSEKQLKNIVDSFSRRDFVKAGSAASAVAMGVLSMPRASHTAGSDTIKIGLVGTGGRGTGAVKNALQAAEGVELVAVGDLFMDRVEGAMKKFSKIPKAKNKLTKDTMFAGFDAFEKVIASDANYIILATPPHFRPMHARAVIEAGKHCFMEKPVAVDPAGCRSVMETAKLAKEKGLGLGTGTQRRHAAHYLEAMKRIENGDIGELVGGSAYWCGGELWHRGKEDSWSEMEYQCRNWLYFTWLSGDHICEQHIHNMDVINWAMGGPPVKALGMGGRQKRVDPKYGNIFDHFAIEYEYENGARVMSMCRQSAGASRRQGEHLVDSKGTADLSLGGAHAVLTGANAFKYKGKKGTNPQVQEHTDLIASIRANEPLNHGKRIAESTMTMVLGRMSAYTGRELKFSWAMNSSKLDLAPPKYDFIDLDMRPVAIPGKTKLV